MCFFLDLSFRVFLFINRSIFCASHEFTREKYLENLGFTYLFIENGILTSNLIWGVLPRLQQQLFCICGMPSSEWITMLYLLFLLKVQRHHWETATPLYSYFSQALKELVLELAFEGFWWRLILIFSFPVG